MRRSALLLVLALGACTFSTDEAPRPIDSVDLGDGVADLVAPDEGVVATLWYVDGTRLVPVEVLLTDDGPDARVQALLSGVGLGNGSVNRSAIPPDTSLLGATTAGGVATLDLPSAFTLVGGDEELLAVGQIVLTATEVPGIDGVLLTIDGDPVQAPTADGALVGRPLSRSDYEVWIVR